jgi:cobalamin biosynthesis protein CbiD
MNLNLRHHLQVMPSKTIDLAAGMRRLHTTEESKAIEALRLLCETLKKDMLILHAAQQKNDTTAALEILNTLQWGLRFTGTPRLETACKMLYEKLKCAQDLSKLFALVYDEANLLAKQYQELSKN